MPAIVERARRTARTHRRAARLAVAGLACAGVGIAVAALTHRYGLTGLALDRAAVRSWLSGDGLYAYRAPDSDLGTAVPPAAAFLLLPAAWLPIAIAGRLLALAGIAALALTLYALAGPVARRYGRPRWRAVLAAGALALLLEPVRSALGLGHLDVLIFGLIVADVVALRRNAWTRSRAAWWPGRPRPPAPHLGGPARPGRRWSQRGTWAGVGIGAATALNLSPVLFIVYLAGTRQWRAAVTAVVTALTLGVGAVLAAPQQSAAYLGEVLGRLDRRGGMDSPGNQSLAGVLARLYDSATTPVLLWLSVALLLAAVGLLRARSAHADGDEVAAFTLVGLTTAIVSPVTGTYELIWVVPAVLILVDAAFRQRVGARRPWPGRPPGFAGGGYAVAAVLTYLLFVTTPMGTLAEAGGVVGMLGGNAYALAVILLINGLPARAGAAPAFPADRWSARAAVARRRLATTVLPH
ncbi:alpha-1,2-mannosyltransferase [Krasilnikovia cinnamomea]|uniref:Alpha-1,2-mannosyltransferase n=1 Tax=Krasilnikovia cinnamomea TaxID=349313 RepID=A0A4Q7ZL24_9ACTN|nr:glycosyltransferase 87 family protein [Krasilnikovia cinnamomea]RZU51053.1 alpha-1,2-mannosyltransferase [Krasilnikovia cinnamomea]